eukprot:2501685-Rhodomonas_salina.2
MCIRDRYRTARRTIALQYSALSYISTGQRVPVSLVLDLREGRKERREGGRGGRAMQRLSVPVDSA